MYGAAPPAMLLRFLAAGRGPAGRLASVRAKTRRSKANRRAFYEHEWRHAAGRCGATVEYLCDDLLEISRGDCRTRVYRNYTQLDDPVTLRLAGNKAAVHRLLAHRGLPVPDYRVFTLRSLGAAGEFLRQRQGQECVVKPAANTGGGMGVSTGVRSRRQLLWSAIVAAAYGPEMLIEVQARGDNYRLLFLDGDLIDAVTRRPPHVQGDGRSTIATLLRRENARRLAQGGRSGEPLITVDADMKRTLAQHGWSLRSAPGSGVRVDLKTVVNQNASVDNEPAIGRVAPAVVRACAEAAHAVGARLAGVDIITPDASRPLAASGGVILEVNTTPSFHVHYRRQQSDGSCRVAQTVLDRLLRAEQENRIPST